MPSPPRGFKNPLVQRYSKEPLLSPGAPPVDALSGTATGVGNVTAALSVAHALAATSTGVGNVTAALSVKHNLAASPTGVGRATGALSVSHALATTSVGVGRAVAALSVAHRLSTTPIGVGFVTAALSVQATAGAVSGGGKAPYFEYLHPTVPSPRPPMRQPAKPVRRPILRPQPRVEASITTDDIFALWASDALSDGEALAALEEVLV